MSEIFALRDSGLSPFLFSNVGMEANGTDLTVLSLLARLGKDPWTEAAAWSLKPRNAAIESLSDSISQMPPNQQALEDAHVTASRLVLLLPPQGASSDAATRLPGLASTPRAGLLALCFVSLFLAFNILMMARLKSEAPLAPAALPVAASTK
jgi:hypothetical protein